MDIRFHYPSHDALSGVRQAGLRLGPQGVAGFPGLGHHLRRVFGRLGLSLPHQLPRLGLCLGAGLRQAGLPRPFRLGHQPFGLRLGLRPAGPVGLLGLGHLLHCFQRHALTAFLYHPGRPKQIFPMIYE